MRARVRAQVASSVVSHMSRAHTALERSRERVATLERECEALLQVVVVVAVMMMMASCART